MMSVSVIIPTYQRREPVKRAIDSVLEQTLRPDEIVVVDDGSTDGTVEALKDTYGSQIILAEQENQGASAARNTGIEASTGDLIAFLDSDDRWMPTKLEKQVPLMDIPDVVLSSTNWRIENRQETAFDGEKFAKDYAVFDEPLALVSEYRPNGMALLSTWIVRRDTFERTGKFDRRLRIGEDNKARFHLAFEGKFAVLSAVGTIYSSTMDEPRLSQWVHSEYNDELSRFSAETLAEIYYRCTDQPPHIQRQVRQLLAYFLVAQAQHAAAKNNPSLARRRAVEALALTPRFADANRALAMSLSPGLYRFVRRFLTKPETTGS